ncbi:hypothetical protein APG05_15480 [Pseudomonas aeruginosa]|nr:hypothetical protein A4W92_00100 [Pseudomonas aeruginosa]OFS95937.1 hypothetical protein HMPREF3141_08855 [Pseudomonas sp. HMSC16B01]KQC69706.1 hypothetical protein APG05_15480 [Pseudomonas aeruginosa]KXC77656.1 hypothetical protein AW895_12470 [Pseudomonas aeruginosa]KXC80397.1 hypothetical protein AW896_12390 [Pseudomonas aeruginosa]
MVEEGVQQFGSGRLGSLFAVVVFDVLERAALVLQLEVVPVLASHEHAAFAVLELEIMNTLKDLGEGFPLLEVTPAVVGRRVVEQIGIGIAQCPARAHR